VLPRNIFGAMWGPSGAHDIAVWLGYDGNE
jgi:hypothetical protein